MTVAAQYALNLLNRARQLAVFRILLGGHRVILQGTIEHMPEGSIRQLEPRWPAAIALLSIGALYYALPSELTVGPDWLALVCVSTGRHRAGTFAHAE